MQSLLSKIQRQYISLVYISTLLLINTYVFYIVFPPKFNPFSHRGMATIFCCSRFRFPLYSGKQTPGGCLAGNDGKHDIELTIGTKFVVLSLMILSLKYTKTQKTHPHTHYHTHSIIQQNRNKRTQVCIPPPTHALDSIPISLKG